MPNLDYDVIIVGSGPAGLTAGASLARAGRRTLVLERDVYGGALQHIDAITDYRAYPDGITGADLASALLEQATGAGVKLEQAEVNGVEVFSRSRFVATTEGRGFSCGVVILAGGARFSSLGLPAEARLRGRGVIDCTPCDAGFYVGKPVVVVGSGDYAERDARYFSSVGAQVRLLPSVDAIFGDERVEGVVYQSEKVAAAGIAVRIGTQPNTEWLADLLELDADGRVPVNADMETESRFVLAVGDLRNGCSQTVAGAAADGEAAARRALALQADQYTGHVWEAVQTHHPEAR
jgi:thioredoxin reductase (NADPH)